MRFLTLHLSYLATWAALSIPVLGNHLSTLPPSVNGTNSLTPVHAHSTKNIVPIVNESTQHGGNIFSEERVKDSGVEGEGEADQKKVEKGHEINEPSDGNIMMLAKEMTTALEVEPCSAGGRGYGLDVAIVSIALLAWEMLEGVFGL
ncbi:hypothetical protein DL95DRAFT_413818 [Leptodontidium sp. 2 PMI_412]|nr:hypothetical protein DL95DRAFT_413818 [Leptodontidium sp. 2 PMI_412]